MSSGKIWLGIFIGVLVSAVIGLTGFIVYDKVLSKDGNETTIDNNNSNDNSISNDSIENVVLDYKVEGEMPNVKISVNGKKVDLIATNIEVVGKLNDVLVVKAWSMDYYSYYIVDKDANIVTAFIGNSASLSVTNYQPITLKGGFTGDCIIEDNSLIIKSDIVSSEPTYNSCNKNDNDIVEYTEKFSYLKNGKFSESKLIKTTTAKEYIQNYNIKCN